MPNFWNVVEGVLLFGRYRIERTLNKTAERAFFVVETEEPGGRGALVEAVRAGAPGAEEQLKSWELGSGLSHPNLIRILETGRDRLEDEAVYFAVFERPDEHLSDVLNERALTVEEARQVLTSIADLLAHLHRTGVVHTNLRAKDVAAGDERIKIPVDRVRTAGQPAPVQEGCAPPEWTDGGVTPAGDMWCLGVLLHEVLTRRPPSFTPEGDPRLEGVDAELARVIRGCLRRDPERRWTAEQVQHYLRGGEVPAEPRAAVPAPQPPAAATPAPPVSGSRHILLLAAVAVLIVLAVIWFVRRPTEPANAPEAARVATPPPAPTAPVPAPAIPPRTVQAPPPARTGTGSWRVIVYTFNARRAAERKAATINRIHPGVNAEVFSPSGNSPFLISIGGRMTRAEAERLEKKARSMGLPRDSYARNYRE